MSYEVYFEGWQAECAVDINGQGYRCGWIAHGDTKKVAVGRMRQHFKTHHPGVKFVETVFGKESDDG